MIKQNPQLALLRFMQEIDGKVGDIAREQGDELFKNLRLKWDSQFADIFQFSKRKLDTLFSRAEAEVMSGIKEHVEKTVIKHGSELKLLKGEPGYTPVKGKDYEDGKTPVADVDYLSLDSSQREFAAIRRDMNDFEEAIKQQNSTDIEKYFKELFEKLEKSKFSKEYSDFLVNKLLDNLPIETLVRRMEQLPYIQKLDYVKGLKNQPGDSTHSDPRRHTLMRGGISKQTYEYDLSDQCDGNRRTFTIPANTRVVLVQCTDAPAGILRKTVDWQGSGTTTLTLSNDVAAPTQGATLSILYVI